MTPLGPCYNKGNIFYINLPPFYVPPSPHRSYDYRIYLLNGCIPPPSDFVPSSKTAFMVSVHRLIFITPLTLIATL